MKRIIFFLILLFPRVVFGIDSKVANSPIANVVDSRHFSEFAYAAVTLTPTQAGNNWYVDGINGSDSYDGKAPAYNGTHGPFKTIGKALDRYSTRKYGDRVLIRAGRYKVRGIGPANLGGIPSENNRFIIGPYGDGEVILDGSNSVAWAVYSGNVYQAILNSGVTVDSIVMDDNYRSCRNVASQIAVDSDGDYFQDGVNLYLYSAGGTPDSRGALVREVDWDNAHFVIYVADSSYVTIYGLTVVSSPSIGIVFYNADHGVVDNCVVKFCGKNGVVMGSNGLVNKSYIYANCMMNWPRGSKWGSTGGWPTGVNIGSSGTIRGCIVGETGGEGINVYGGGVAPVLIEDNIVFNNYSVNIYVDSHPNAAIRRNFLYGSNPDFSDITGVIPQGSSLDGIKRRMRPQGIMIGDETASGGGSEYEEIYNNIILGCRNGVIAYSQAIGSGWKNSKIYSNTIITPDADPAAIPDSFCGLSLGTNNNNVATAVMNNIIIGVHANSYLIDRGTDNGIILNNNLYYHYSNLTPFKYNGTTCSFINWQARSLQDAMSINLNPLLAGNFSTGQSAARIADFSLAAGSPALNTGADLGLSYATDYNMTARPSGSAWDIGTYEYAGGALLSADTIVLSAPTGLASWNITQVSLDLSWPVSTDNVGVSGYKVYRNGVQIGTTAATSYSDSGLSAATTYQYTVSAFDAAGNESAQSAGIQVTTLPITYSLNTIALDGSVTRSPDLASYILGTSVTLTAVPNTGYQFSGWSGDLTGTINPVNITMDGNKTITANFALKTYNIIASAGTGGLITPSGSISVNYGQSQAFSMSADTGYKISDVLVDGVSTGAASSYTFTNVTAAHTMTANFTLIPLTPPAPINLTATALGKGKIKLTWLDNSNNETGFYIEGSTNGTAFSQIATVAANTATYNKLGWPGVTYYYRVRAYNNAGNSEYSNIAVVKAQK